LNAEILISSSPGREKRDLVRQFLAFLIALNFAFGAAFASVASKEYVDARFDSADSATKVAVVTLENGNPVVRNSKSLAAYTAGNGISISGMEISNDSPNLTTVNIVGSTSGAVSNASASNGNVYLNAVENGVVKSSHKITGSGNTTVTSDSSGNIAIYSYASSQMLSDCTGAIANTVKYSYNSGRYFSQSGEFFTCACNKELGYVDFSVKVVLGNSIMGNPIADFRCPGSAMAINQNVPFRGCIFMDGIILEPKFPIICDIEATGLDRFAKDVNKIDCSSSGGNDQLCATVVSGIAIWSRNTSGKSNILINFGNELWGPGNENTVFLHCSGWASC
jgi:hypothetical protein